MAKYEPTIVIRSLNRVSSNYVKLQQKYREWAMGFENHEYVISWLRNNNVKEKTIEKCKRQDSFNLLSSNWNPITFLVLQKIASNDIAQIEKEFGEFYQNFTQDDCGWYLLYFIHPVLHELFYFNTHYPKGYYSRLAELIRSHRLGLKSAKTYLNKEGNADDDSHIKACSTTTFKHIHLHPTTSTWKNSDSRNLKTSILNLKIGEDNLSPDEISVAMELSANARTSFERWSKYAPCAINEGPIFILKEGEYHSKCLGEVIKILQSVNPSQDILRDKLEEYYKIDE